MVSVFTGQTCAFARFWYGARFVGRCVGAYSLIWVVLSSIAPASAAPLRFSEGPPAGFEGLQEKQTGKVDVYFAGSHLASVLAHYDRDTIEFNNLETLASALPAVKDREQILEALKGVLPTNSDKVCDVTKSDGCATLNPPVAAVIFDEARFRVELVIHQDLLLAVNGGGTKFLPPPPQELALFTKFRQVFSGGAESPRYRTTIDSIASYGRTRLESRVTVANDTEVELERIAAVYEGSRHALSWGKLMLAGSTAAIDEPTEFVGLRFESSQRTRLDRAAGETLPLELFLSQRSRVEIHRDGNLLHSRIYGAGMQLIDTSSLASGTYWITLKIFDGAGERSETRLFSRTLLLAPYGQSIYGLEVGKIYQDPTAVQHETLREALFARVHARFRLGDTLGAEAGQLRIDGGQPVSHAGLTWLKPGGFVFGTLVHSGSHGLGGVFGVRQRVGTIDYGLNYRESFSKSGVSTETSELSDPGRSNRRYTDLSASMPLLGGNLHARGLWEVRTDVPATNLYNLGYRRQIWRRGPWAADLGLEYRREPDDSSLTATVTWRATSEGRSQSLGLSVEHRGSDNSTNPAVAFQDARSLFQTDERQFSADTFVYLRERVGEFGVGLNAESARARGRFDAQVIERENVRHSLVSSEFEAVILANRSGLAITSDSGGQAGLIVDIDGEESGDFEILINGMPGQIVRAGYNRAVLLSPFKRYDVALRPRGRELVAFDPNPRQVTVFPGSVPQLKWAVNSIDVIVAQAVYPDGSPVANALIEGLKEFAITEENGWFQVEVAGEVELIMTPSTGSQCVIKLPTASERQEIALLGRTICVPSSQ